MRQLRINPLNRKVRAIGFAVWAGLAVPLLFASYVGLSYRLALREGKLPFVEPNEWRWDSAYFTLLASGIAAVAVIPISRRWVRVLLAISYAAVMGIALLFVSLSLSCGNGDCL
jgi:hypothetical protein